MHQSVTPTGLRLGRIGDFSKGALGHHVVFVVSGLAGQGSSTVRPSGQCLPHSCIDAVWHPGAVCSWQISFRVGPHTSILHLMRIEQRVEMA